MADSMDETNNRINGEPIAFAPNLSDIPVIAVDEPSHSKSPLEGTGDQVEGHAEQTAH